MEQFCCFSCCCPGAGIHQNFPVLLSLSKLLQTTELNGILGGVFLDSLCQLMDKELLSFFQGIIY